MNHFSTQTLAQGNQRLALEERGEVEWILKEVFVLWLVNYEWGGRRGFYTTAQKLAVTVLSRVSSVLPTRCRYYQGVSQKPNSEDISVVPTLGWYYRPPGQNSPVKLYRYYRPGVGTTDYGWEFEIRLAKVRVSTLGSSHSLGLSPRALLASLCYQFTSPL
jgi:hypothetical protein